MIGAIMVAWPNAECDFGARNDKVGDDARLLGTMLSSGNESSVLRLWDNSRHLVISKRLARLPGAERARGLAQASGYPITVRASGGTAVVHRPGVLNISLFRVARHPLKLAAGFDRLCDIIIQAALRIGLHLTTGLHARSYCSGTHDIGWRGRKLAGTAAVARRHNGLHGQIFHASLVVHGDWRSDVAVLSRFEREAGLETCYDLEAHISLAEAQDTELFEALSMKTRSCLGEQPNFSL